jgi:hypothetical protein
MAFFLGLRSLRALSLGWYVARLWRWGFCVDLVYFADGSVFIRANPVTIFCVVLLVDKKAPTARDIPA